MVFLCSILLYPIKINASDDLLTWLHDQNRVRLKSISWFTCSWVSFLIFYSDQLVTFSKLQFPHSLVVKCSEIKWGKLYKVRSRAPVVWKKLHVSCPLIYSHYKCDSPLLRLPYIDSNTWKVFFYHIVKHVLKLQIILYPCQSAILKHIHKCFVKQ